MIFVEARTLGSTTNDNDLLHVQEDDRIVRLTRKCREDSFDLILKPRMFMRIQIFVPTKKLKAITSIAS